MKDLETVKIKEQHCLGLLIRIKENVKDVVKKDYCPVFPNCIAYVIAKWMKPFRLSYIASLIIQPPKITK